MTAAAIILRGEVSPSLSRAIDDLNALIEGRDLQLDVDRSVELRELFRQVFVDGVLDASNLIRIDSHPPALGASYTFLSFEPTELFLDLLAALRAGDRDVL